MRHVFVILAVVACGSPQHPSAKLPGERPLSAAAKTEPPPKRPIFDPEELSNDHLVARMLPKQEFVTVKPLTSLQGKNLMVLELLGKLAPAGAEYGPLLSISVDRFHGEYVNLSAEPGTITLNWRRTDGSSQQSGRWKIERPIRGWLVVHCFIRPDSEPQLYIDGKPVALDVSYYKASPWVIGSKAKLKVGQGYDNYAKRVRYAGIIPYAALYSALSKTEMNAHVKSLHRMEVERRVEEVTGSDRLRR